MDHKIGTGQKICEILSLENYREFLPVITSTVCLPKQGLNGNTTNKQANNGKEISRDL